MQKRITSLSLCLIITALYSCGGGTAVSEDTTAASVYEETDAITDTYIYDNLPEKDFGGADYNILTTTWYSAPRYIYAESQNGDVMNDAIYESLSKVSERFNVKINLTADQDFGALSTTIHNLVMAGDDTYHTILNHDLKTVANALNGDFLNIRDLPKIDFSKPWWNGTSDVFTINGKLLFTGNCLSISGIFMNYVLAANKSLAEDNNVVIPYDKVVAGEWYLDDFIELTKDTMLDLDGNSKYDQNDQYGFVTSYYGHLGMQSDLVGTVLEKDKDGFLTFIENTERIVGILEKVEKLMLNGKDDYGKSNMFGVELFVENKAVFIFCENRTLYDTVRESNITYGILPFPKYDENQESYRSSGCDMYWAVPITASGNADLIGTMLEAISCSNYNDVVPKVWELVLGRKLADSQEDTDMFNIIRDIQYVDLGYAYSGQSSELTDLVFMTDKTTSDQAISYIAARKDAVIAKINEINKFYSENN